MKDRFGNTIEDYKRRIRKYEDNIIDYNDWMNYHLQPLFIPEYTPNYNWTFTKKGTIKKRVIKKIMTYKWHIKLNEKSIAKCKMYIQDLETKIKEQGETK